MIPSQVILSLALMLVAGYLLTRVTKKLRLPNVTAYISAGILLGPYVLGWIPAEFVSHTDFLPDIALAFIAFGTGEFFRVSALKKSGGSVLIITLLESLLAAFFVFAVTFFLLRLPLPFSLVLSALSAATAPASTLMTIRQTGARGDFVNTLLQVVALDDVVALLAFSAAVALAKISLSGPEGSAGLSSPQLSALFLPLLLTAASLLLGALFGGLLALFMKKRHSTDNRLIIAVALLLMFCGICASQNVSPLLGCMVMSAVYINLTDDEKLFRQLGYFQPPLLLLFFVRSGLSFDLSQLLSPQGSLSGIPLIWIGVIYFAVRIAGKYAGAYAGCRLTRKPSSTTNNLGLALIPQAGVAIGLAHLGERTLGGSAGQSLLTIILASSVLYELAGPALAKLALARSGSFSRDLEDLTSVPETDPSGKRLTAVDILAARILEIQKTLPQRDYNPEEEAFTQAALEQYETIRRQNGQRGLARKHF